MKRKRVYMVLAIIFSGLVLVFLLDSHKINISSVSRAEVTYVYGEKDISQELTEEELQELKTIFNGKRFYRDNPSCGFSEDISIKLDDSITFCIARDTCPYIYWQEGDRYIKLTEKEQQILYDILKKYGATFPCV